MEADGLFHAISSPLFMAAFQVNRHVFAYTKGLSQLLQGSTEDVVRAHSKVKAVHKVLDGLRKKENTEYAKIFKVTQEMAEMAGTTMSIPRRCGRQTRCNNMPRETPEVYYRRVVFVPFMDDLLDQLRNRFTGMTAKALTGFKLLPANVTNLSDQDVADLKEQFEPDLPSPDTLQAEISVWKKWECADIHPKPDSLSEVLAVTNQLMYPNIHRMLYILMIIPVTSAGVERANLALKLVKTVMRSTMEQDRFNGLILMYVHKDMALNYERVIDSYARKHPRRMLFLNPLSG